MRFPLLVIAALATVPAVLSAQRRPLPAADSALIGRILLAEDRRDSTDRALVVGLRHADARIRTLAQRARGRIGDPRYAARDSLPPLRTPVLWPEPAWRRRYRALADRRNDCGAVRLALIDSAWPVRLRAADVITSACATDDSVAATLREWIDALPSSATARGQAHRARVGVSWHAAAHAIVALAHIRPDEAKARLAVLASHRQWHVRAYAARAAEVLGDTVRLRALARDADDNVKEAAIQSLAKRTGHIDDDVFLEAFSAKGAQAVRAGAAALAGSGRADVRVAAAATFERWASHGNASERDVRLALLEAAGRPASDDTPPVARAHLSSRAVALALGADIRLRVIMSASSGGGSFVVRLRGDVAPIMAAHVLALAHAGYYDGLDWHRVEPDFVIQGGSPGANEYVGLPQYLRDELGSVPHLRGTVGMSTRGHDTGDGQWFVNLKDNLRLNRDYTIFGEVIEGMDIVDGVLEGDVIAKLVDVTRY